MTDKELREIRRRFRPDKNSILSIRGCLVNADKEIVTKFNQPMATCSNEESEKILSIMKKSLSGSLGTNLIDLEFGHKQITEGDEHKLLMALRDSRLQDENAENAFYQRVIESADFEDSFVILLAMDNYDVFTYTKDGEKEDSDSVFSYIICSICPVKPLNTGLYFRESDSSFRAFDAHSMLSNPEIGFMFPAFDDRAANIYNALYYTRDITNIHPAFIERIFNTDLPMSAAEQKDNFDSCLKETLDEECDFEVMRSVHDQISDMVKEHKDTKQIQPLKLTKSEFKTVLECCGVDGEKVERFGNKFDEQFGKNAEIAPKSIVDVKKFEVNTPDISIKVNPDRTDLVSTQVINGVKYIMIRANEGVEVNGVNIDIK